MTLGCFDWFSEHLLVNCCLDFGGQLKNQSLEFDFIIVVKYWIISLSKHLYLLRRRRYVGFSLIYFFFCILFMFYIQLLSRSLTKIIIYQFENQDNLIISLSKHRYLLIRRRSVGFSLICFVFCILFLFYIQLLSRSLTKFAKD